LWQSCLFDIFTARFIVSLGDSTENRDYQFTVFRRGINIIIFEDEVDAQMVQFTQCGNNAIMSSSQGLASADRKSICESEPRIWHVLSSGF